MFAVITAPGGVYPVTGDDSHVQYYRDTDLGFVDQFSIPSLTLNGVPYASHGKYAFWDDSETKLFVVAQVDSTANLAADSVIYSLSHFYR